MLLDVLKMRRCPERRHVPIEMPQPFVQSRISRSNVADIAFEMLDVDGVEADEGRV